jgi:hypothetical protein
MKSTVAVVIALFGLLDVVTAADVPVEYTVSDSALKSTPAGTPLTFTLYSDATCTTATHTQVIALQDVAVIERLKRMTPNGGAKPPKTTELHTTLTDVAPAAAHYLTVTGSGVTPIGGTCQAQAAGVPGPQGSEGPPGPPGPASGWTDGGGAVYLTTPSDSVGIGTLSPDASLHVAGTALFRNQIDGVNTYAFQTGGGSPVVAISTRENVGVSEFETVFKVSAQGSLFQPYSGETDHALLVTTANGFDLFRINTANRVVSVGPAQNDASLVVVGDLLVTGTKNFVHPHPSDPTKEITYAALEGGEAGTYFRGSATLSNGEATI